MNARSATEAGFTIVETLIVLAVSALMFTLAITAMSGKQQQTEFRTGLDTLQSDLNNALANVTNGNYQDQAIVAGVLNYTTCIAAGPNIINTQYTTYVPSPDGSCDAIGEIITFGNESSAQESYYILPVFGCTYINCVSSDGLVTSLGQADIVYAKDIYKTESMPYGLTIADPAAAAPSLTITYDNGHSADPAESYGAIGVFNTNSFETNGSPNSIASGAQHIEIAAIPNTLPENNTPPPIGSATESQTLPGYGSGLAVNPASGVTFCVNSGTDSQSALFTIGGNNNSGDSVSYQIYNKLGCTD